jgi:hypothetical protein
MYHVTYQDQIIGTSRLEHADSTMGVAFGEFEPTPAYMLVHDVFHMFVVAEETKNAELMARYSRERDALNLSLENERGLRTETSWIHIYDYRELGRELEVQTGDPVYWAERNSAG